MTTDSFKVRAAGATDAEAIASLELRFFRSKVERYGVNDEQYINLMPKILQRSEGNNAANLVAIQDEVVVGYTSAEPWARSVDTYQSFLQGGLAVLAQVAVSSRWQRRGIGAALVEKTSHAMGRRGYSVMAAHIPDHLREWYTHLGWDVLPRHSGLTWIETARPGSDAVLPPGAPPEVAATHTQFYAVVPDGDGYDSLAVRAIGPTSGVIAMATFPVDGEKSGAPARALLAALEAAPEAKSRVPEHSYLLLAMEIMSQAERHSAAAQMMRLAR